jgi:2-dehydropantoate 2-reductase
MGVPNRPSLLQDVIKGRRTEVDALNGAIVRHGTTLGIATPMNAALIETLHAIEAGEIQPGPHNLARLMTVVPW